MNLSHFIKYPLFLFLFSISLFGEEPEVLFLTWRSDPSTTMVVRWHTETGEEPSILYYKRKKQNHWQDKKNILTRIQSSNIIVHEVELTDLEPDSEYDFKLGEGNIHTFKTLPKTLNRPVKVAIGGDGYHHKNIFQKMNREVASKEPDFVILAGDIAYTEGLRTAFRSHYWRVNRWEDFFKMWSKDMVTKEGRLIPIVPVIGNHDVKEGFDNPFKKKVLFYEHFAFPEHGKSYRTMKIGDKAVFYLLDSGHTFPVGGAQTEWLAESLHLHKNLDFHFPVYHIAAYPTDTSFSHRGAVDIRKFWVPLFEKHGVKISFEHDNHTFKKTHPLRNGKIDPEGILYVGDGSWGVSPCKPKAKWYLHKATEANCYWLLSIDTAKCNCVAYDIEGKELDQFEIHPIKK